MSDNGSLYIFEDHNVSQMRACKESELRIDFSAQVDTNNDIKKKKKKSPYAELIMGCWIAKIYLFNWVDSFITSNTLFFSSTKQIWKFAVGLDLHNSISNIRQDK